MASLDLASLLFFFSSRRRHTRLQGDWSSDVCSSDLSSVTSLRASRLYRISADASTTTAGNALARGVVRGATGTGAGTEAIGGGGGGLGAGAAGPGTCAGGVGALTCAGPASGAGLAKKMR